MLVQYAVFWYLAIQFQSGVVMMLAALFGFLPQAVISLFGGVWADRHNRKLLIMGADAAIALSTLCLALIMLAGFTRAVADLRACSRSGPPAPGSRCRRCPRSSRRSRPPTQLIRVNGFLGVDPVRDGAARPGRGRRDLRRERPRRPSGSPHRDRPDPVHRRRDRGDRRSALLATIPVARSVRRARTRRPATSRTSSTGCATSRDHAFVRWLLVLFAIIFVLTVAPANLMPLMLVRSFAVGRAENVVNLALLEMAFSVGMVAGRDRWSRRCVAKRDRIGMIVASSLTFGVLSIALGLAPSLLVVFGFMFLFGLAVPFFSTPSMTLLQETVEPERQGRVFGFVGIVMALAMPIGMLVFGPLADVVPIETILVVTGLADLRGRRARPLPPGGPPRRGRGAAMSRPERWPSPSSAPSRSHREVHDSVTCPSSARTHARAVAGARHAVA